MPGVDYIPGTPPTAQDVASARQAANLTQADAAAVVYLSGQARWAEYEAGRKSMDAARFELFLVKTGLHPALGAQPL